MLSKRNVLSPIQSSKVKRPLTPLTPSRSRISVVMSETPNIFRLVKSPSTPEDNQQEATISFEPALVKQSIATMCANLLDVTKHSSRKKETFKAPDEISSIVNKILSETLSVKLASIIDDMRPNKDNKERLVTNIYIMIGMFISLLKLFDVSDKLLHVILLGDVGNKVDAMYKIGLSIAALTMTKKNQFVMEFKLPDSDVIYAISRDPMSVQYKGGQHGGMISILDLDMNELQKMHTRIYANLKKILDFLR